MSRKKGTKYSNSARLIVFSWLRACGVDVDQRMSNQTLLDAYNWRAPKRRDDLKSAANAINPRFIPDVREPKSPKIKCKKTAAWRGLRPKRDKAAAFYRSADWKRVRYDALQANDGRCELCGQGKHENQILNVDHIKPVRLFWKLRLDPENLQVLCGDCNCGKGNRDETDWREKIVEPSLRVLMGEAMD